MKRIVCVGELLIDFMGSETNKKLSEQQAFKMLAGGAPANVACTVSALGGQCFFIGAVGSDGFGDFLEREIQSFGVETAYLKRSILPTTLAFVSVEASGERDFVFNRGADADLKMADIPTEVIDQSEIIHFGGATGFLEGDLQNTYSTLLSQTSHGNHLISFDPNYRSAFWQHNQETFKALVKPFMKKADLIKLSDEEAYLLAGTNDLKEAMTYFKGLYEATFAITLGAEGVQLFCRTWEARVAAPKVKVVDTTGAGDSFVGALLYDLSRENHPKTLLKDQEAMIKIASNANQIAASVCTHFGALTALKLLINASI